MNAVIPFAFEDSLVRALWRKGDPWFVAKDVCGALELRDVSDAAEKLDNDEKGRASIPTLGGPQDLLIVSEGGLYSIVLRCRDAMKPGTVPHRFRRWVTGEVLPSLRKTGQYTAPTAPAPEAIEERNLRAEEHKLALVARMQAMKGPAYAYALYEKLGLPTAIPEMPSEADAARIDRAGRPFNAKATITSVRTFIQENRARFVSVGKAGADRTWSGRDLAGFIGPRGNFLSLDDAWREAIGGVDPHSAADALAESGHLLKDASGKRKRAERIGGRTMRVWVVRREILNVAAHAAT